MSHSENVVELLHAGQFDQMASEIEKAIQVDPAELLADLAEYLSMMGFSSESRQVYEVISQENTANTDIILNLAEMKVDDGDLDGALALLYQVTSTDDNYVAALVMIADLYQLDGVWEAALEKLQEASTLSDSPLVSFAIAELHYNQANWQEAIDYFAKLSQRQILELTKVSIYQRIGTAYASLGEFENAEKFLEKSLEINHDDTVLFELAQISAVLGEHKRAIDYFKQLDALAPDFDGYAYPYAQALIEENEFDSAFAVAKDGLSKNPTDVPLLHLTSRIAYALHDLKASETYLVQALDLAELHDETIFLLSNLYLLQADYEAVINLAPLLDDDHALARWNIAKAYGELEKDTEALAIYDEIDQSVLADNPEFLLDYAHILIRNGRANDAKLSLTQYLASVPDDENAQELFNELI
ncbi:tetratricopeptide repeat protein [Lactococcus paracarnosus]|uniref:Tetratricopeptide repeat protein n=1 Tax=Pseudolactococcus paracarnosus TaxID=2749962 RepID=A0A7L4WF52_9LACT|nr:tetratricopeptide repeat protein [Lactococcus paracarnosus]SPC35588.1 TPR-repeat-containing protein [Lactococcus piscium]MCJ1976344.1 tetratricopeptide repeat protein [Lactococcus paracarnosus]MCJ1982930.1 tetratricopeptide repeat protein [Lactococcus paracarnosus]MCJ1994323.1 tetratricopeptide repeat protein [Lactococcus paracarnosus]MCJ1998426.1 tetratricopeptide repeat protein [Lactococcus paracarnosus]